MSGNVQEHSLVAGIGLVAPAVRSVVVFAYANLEAGEIQVDVEYYPVLAIRSTIVHRYLHRPGPRALRGATPAEMVDIGWTYNGHTVEDEFLIVGEDWGVGTTTEILGNTSNGAYEPVACPWPPEEDEVKLVVVIARVQQEAIRNLRRREPKTPTEAAPSEGEPE
jgi:hypothetical protein